MASKCLHSSQVANQAEAYPGFLSMHEATGNVSTPPPKQPPPPPPAYPVYHSVTPQHQIRRYSFIHLGEERHYEREAHCLRTQRSVLARSRTARSGVLSLCT